MIERHYGALSMVPVLTSPGGLTRSTPSEIRPSQRSISTKEGRPVGAPLRVDLSELDRAAACLQVRNTGPDRYVRWAGHSLARLDKVGQYPRTARGKGACLLPEASRRV
jgi:hypothetical protein